MDDHSDLDHHNINELSPTQKSGSGSSWSGSRLISIPRSSQNMPVASPNNNFSSLRLHALPTDTNVAEHRH